MAEKITIGLSTSAVDKLTSLGVILSGAAVEDLDVDVFILVNAGHAFMKNSKVQNEMSDNVQTGEEFNSKLNELSSPGWLEMFEMAKEMTNVKVYMCSLAGKIAGGESMDDFIDIVDEICGIGEYMDSLDECDKSIFI